MFNYTKVNHKGTVKTKEYLKRKIIALLAGINHKRLKLDAYGSEISKIDNIYCFSQRGLIKPAGAKSCVLGFLHKNKNFNNKILILGQPVSRYNYNYYIAHLGAMMNTYAGENIYFKLHPRETLTEELEKLLTKHDVKLDQKKSLPELNPDCYKIISGITSSALMNAKIIDSNVECHFFPLNLWSLPDSQYTGLINSLCSIGCIRKDSA